MRRYFFGYLFVRFAKIIAVLVLVGGVGGAAVRYLQGSLEAASIRYEPSSATGLKLFTLAQEWNRMRQLIAVFKARSAPVMMELDFANTPTKAADFAALAKQFDKIQEQRYAVKDAVVQQFEIPIREIEEKLRAHASRLATPQPSTPPPSPKAEPQSQKDDEKAAPKTLFASLGRSEISTRRGLLAESQDFISVLKNSVENPENAEVLARALRELSDLERLLPMNLESTPRSPPKIESANPPPVAPKLNADRVADQLLQARSLVRAALLTNWSVDQALAQAMTEVESERKRCLEAGRTLQRLWLSVATMMALTIVGSLLISFLTLVLADLTQTFLDTAINTAVVASAYTNAGAAEEPPGHD